MPELPARTVPVPTDQPSQRERQVIAARRQVENAIVGNELQTYFKTECALVDMRAAGEVSASAIDCEMKVYFEAMEKAGTSAAAAAVVADHLQDLKEVNRRIFRETFR